MINYARQEEIEGGERAEGNGGGGKSQQKGDHIDKAPASP